jgi:hypothetical protein
MTPRTLKLVKLTFVAWLPPLIDHHVVQTLFFYCYFDP